MGGAGDRTGRIEAIEAPVCFRHGGLPVEWRMQVAEPLGQLRLRDNLLVKGHSLAHLESMTSVHSNNNLSKTGSRCIMKDDMILLVVPLCCRNQE